MNRTLIEWTNFTVNPIEARPASAPGAARSGHYCEKISPGCKNCYASRMQPRFGLPQFQEQRGEHMPVLSLNPKKLVSVLARKRPAKIFWCDMTDLFGDWVSNEWIAACFGVMAATQQHTHQILTKRAERMRKWFEWASRVDMVGDGIHACVTEMFGVPEVNAFLTKHDSKDGFEPGRGDPLIEDPPEWPLPNVHLGVSAENQETANDRIPALLATPAAVRWVSAEPLLGKLDLRSWLEIDRERGNPKWIRSGFAPELDWVVVGGESGQRARRFEPAWAELLVAQCKAAGVAVFVKQMGANVVVPNDGRLAPCAFEDGEENGWPPERPDGQMYQIDENINGFREEHQGAPVRIRLMDSHGGDLREWPRGLRVREFPTPRTP